MEQSPSIEGEGALNYDRVRMHLSQARLAAERLGDRAVLTLIDTIQQLCYSRSGFAESSGQSSALAPSRASVGSLHVYFLGSFQAYLNGSLVGGWRKKSESVFKYLVVHRATPVHREQLLDTFWPDADPQAARNCLNVTLHALRHSLEPGTRSKQNGGLVCSVNNHYVLHPDLQIWADADAFTEYLTQGQAATRRNDPASAIAHYEAATTLYRGDFLEADRYEDWTTSHRERARSAYMGLLTHLSQLYFETGDYTSSLECSRKILDRDNCYEDAHCQIMRCHYALGQRGLAVRQYFISRDTLDRELGLPPMEATTQLYEQIKNG